MNYSHIIIAFPQKIGSNCFKEIFFFLVSLQPCVWSRATPHHVLSQLSSRVPVSVKIV